MATLDLRPLSLGELLDRTFFMYRRNFWLFAGIAAMPYLLLLVTILVILVLGLFLYVLPARGNVPPAFAAVAAIAGGIVIFAAVIAFLVSLLYSAGATVFAVSEIYAGRQPSIRGSYRLVRGKGGTLFGVLFLSGLIMVAGFIALIIPGIYLLCRIPVATASALIEDLGPADAIRRSFDLTRSFAGRSGLIYLLGAALTYGVGFMFQVPFLVLVATAAKESQMVMVWSTLGQIGNVLGSLLVAPVPTISFALFYYDLRVRKEAFDLQMMMQAIGGDPAPPPITGGVPSMFGRDAF